MSVNKYQPHVLVLPEDDANSQLANGFLLDLRLNARRIQVLPEAGGWREVLDRYKTDHIARMEAYPHRYMVLLIDFDGERDRLVVAKAAIPSHLTERVFVLGVWTEPEDLRKAQLGTYETIGKAMAEDCRDETGAIWGHELLRHNASEISRMRDRVRPILFEAA